MTMGEFERLKEFGIKKDMIMAESAKKYGEDVVFNAKGQMLDQEKMMTVLQDIMVQKFQGGAEKQSKTVRGMWSTITGVTKVGMASILGIATEGENAGNIIKGSFLDKVATGVTELATKLQEFQSSGVFTAMQTGLSEFTTFLGNAFNKIKEVVTPVIEMLVNTFGPIFSDVFNVITQTVLPALGAAFDAIFPKLMETFSSVGEAITSVWEGVIKPVWDAMAPVLQGVVDAIGPIIESALQVIKGLADFVSNVFKGQWSEAWDGVQSAFSGVIDFMSGLISGFVDTVMAIPRAIGKVAGAIKDKITGGGGGKGEANANGTAYFGGGTSLVNERGGEMQVLPNGTSIIPADRTKQMIENKTNNSSNNVTINIDAKGMNVDELVSTLELRLANM